MSFFLLSAAHNPPLMNKNRSKGIQVVVAASAESARVHHKWTLSYRAKLDWGRKGPLRYIVLSGAGLVLAVAVTVFEAGDLETI